VLERAREAFGQIQIGVESVQERVGELQAASHAVAAVARTAATTSGEAADASARATTATAAIDESATQLAAEAAALAESVTRFRLS